MQGTCLSHLTAMRRLALRGPCVEALFCDMKGLPASLTEAAFSAPRGEVVAILDDGANVLAESPKAFRVCLVCCHWPQLLSVDPLNSASE